MRRLRKISSPLLVATVYVVALAWWSAEKLTTGLVAAAVLLGLGVGLAAEVLLFFSSFSSRARKPGLVHTVFLVAAVHGALVLGSMARRPQLYAHAFYARGGLPRTIQIFATDVLGPSGVLVLAFVCAIVYVRPRPVAFAARRMLRPLRLLVPSALGLLSCSHGKGKEDERPNVLLVTVGSLRADHVTPEAMPALAALAAKSTRFDRAHVSLPRSFPSLVTLFTGRHAHHHRIRSTLPAIEERTRDFDALPSRFARAGYTTVAVTDRPNDVFTQLDLGFSRVVAPSRFDANEKRALARVTPLLPLLASRVGRKLFPVMREVVDDPRFVAEDAVAALSSVRGRAFVSVHFSSAGPPYASRVKNTRYRGRFKYEKPAWADTPPPDVDDVRQIRALYDGAVRATDEAIGRVLDSVDLNRTVVVVTAENGETLGEDGRGFGAGDHLFGDASTHVPLVVWDPRRPARRAEANIVRDVDVAATLYEIAAVPAPGDLDGRSFVAALENKPLDARSAVAETETWPAGEVAGLPHEMRMAGPTLLTRHRMIRDERWKLVYVPRRTGPQYLLFDTASDPSEKNEVAASHAAEVAKLRADLWAWMARDAHMEQRDGLLVPRGTR